MYIASVITFLKRQILIYYGTAILVQALTGPEGSRRFRLSDFERVGT